MKDRWKVFWISVVFGFILSAMFLFLGFSFRKVQLSNWGIVMYDYYKLIDSDQLPRTSGNYLIGLDHKFLQFPKGFLHHQFTIKILTKDKSILQVQGSYIGRLIYNKLINMTLTYGYNYQEFLFISVQRLFREGMQQFSLNEIISNRVAVDSYVRNYVKSNIGGEYDWIQTKFIGLGAIKTQLSIKSIQNDITLEQNYLNLVNQTLFNQKKINVYQNGGYQLIENVEKLHSDLFKNVTSRIVSISDKLKAKNVNDNQQLLSASVYIVNDIMMPYLDKNIQFTISK